MNDPKNKSLPTDTGLDEKISQDIEADGLAKKQQEHGTMNSDTPGEKRPSAPEDQDATPQPEKEEDTSNSAEEFL